MRGDGQQTTVGPCHFCSLVDNMTDRRSADTHKPGSIPNATPVKSERCQMSRRRVTQLKKDIKYMNNKVVGAVIKRGRERQVQGACSSSDMEERAGDGADSTDSDVTDEDKAAGNTDAVVGDKRCRGGDGVRRSKRARTGRDKENDKV